MLLSRRTGCSPAWHFRLLSALEEPKRRGELEACHPAGGAETAWSCGRSRIQTWLAPAAHLTCCGWPFQSPPCLSWLSLSLASGVNYRPALLLGLGLAGVTAIGLLLDRFTARQTSKYYEVLLAPHLALLAWACIGAYLVGLRSNAADRFAFLVKSIEVFITGGVYLIAGMAFGAITLGMFAASALELPEVLIRLNYSWWRRPAPRDGGCHHL